MCNLEEGRRALPCTKEKERESRRERERERENEKESEGAGGTEGERVIWGKGRARTGAPEFNKVLRGLYLTSAKRHVGYSQGQYNNSTTVQQDTTKGQGEYNTFE